MRHATLATANRWLNDPRILPFHSADPLDLSPVWGCVVCFEFDSGCIAFHRDGDWFAHLMLVPGAGNAIRHAHESLQSMFSRDDCQKVVGRIHPSNKRAIRFTEGLGFVHVGQSGDYEQFEITKDQFKESA